jgi:hypothetical protein
MTRDYQLRQASFASNNDWQVPNFFFLRFLSFFFVILETCPWPALEPYVE